MKNRGVNQEGNKICIINSIDKTLFLEELGTITNGFQHFTDLINTTTIKQTESFLNSLDMHGTNNVPSLITYYKV